MITVFNGKNVVWRKGMTITDLLRELNENRAFVGVFINGRYGSRSHFSILQIPDQAEVQLIPWQEGMTVSELLKYQIDEEYFSAATVNRRLIPEADFDKTLISKDAEVWLLTPVGGG